MRSSLWDKFICQRCGECCKNLGLPWDPRRIDRIAAFLNISKEDLITRYYGDIIENNDGKYIEMKDELRKPCPFLDDDRSCKIYPVRPEPCNLYPIETDFGRCGIDCPAMKIILDEINSINDSEQNTTYYLDLKFNQPYEEIIPWPPSAFIFVKQHSEDKDRDILISPQCVSFREIEECINLLISELEDIRNRAKEKFDEARKIFSSKDK